MKYLFIAIICTISFSCFGPIAECRYNCVPVLLNGKVINKETNDPVPDIKIELTIIYSFNSEDRTRVLKKFKTDQYGKFNLVYRLDTNNLASNSYMYLVVADDKYKVDNKDTVFKRGSMYSGYNPTAFVDVTLPVYRQ